MIRGAEAMWKTSLDLYGYPDPADGQGNIILTL